MNDAKVAELAQSNGRGEVGTSGLEVYYGQIQKADNAKLFWPEFYQYANKLLRRDPQVAQWRVATASMASKVDWYWELPQESPASVDEAFVEFLHTIWEDLPGGQRKLIDTYIHYILMGWEWFENVPGRRDGTKQAGWESVHDDGLVGFRDIAWRDHSSFSKWNIDERTGKLFGFIQRDTSGNEENIPLDRSTHITLGDPTSPEGLSPFEALWRLESFMYNLELILGIGSEHAAGHAKFQSEEKLTDTDQSKIKESARAILSATEGNYLTLPGHITADIIDVAFSAGPGILESIKHYGHLKAQVLNMQWMSLSLDGVGSNASMFTSANMWLTAFNAQMNGAAKVIGEQLATQLRRYNSGVFGSVKRLPVLKATPVEANIDLLELAQFVTAMVPVMELTDEDLAAIRRKSNFLTEIEIAEIVKDEETVNDELDEIEPVEETPEDEQESGDFSNAVKGVFNVLGSANDLAEKMLGNEKTEGDREFAQIVANGGFVRAMVDGEEKVIPAAEFARPVAIGKNQPTVTDEDDLADLDDPEDIKRMIRRIERMDPFIADLLKAEADGE